VSELETASSNGRGDLRRFLRETAGHVSMSLNVGRRWSRAERQPETPVSLDKLSLNAIIPTWCEEDIIASTVANAFTQGCQRVFIVDNDSPDGTTAEARKAGAEIACVYHTEYWLESRKRAEIVEVMQAAWRDSGADHVWWMLCDADEFPHGPQGLTIAEYLSTLDRRFRVVGARVFNHFPSGEPANVPGRHPLEFQPLCQEVRVAWCSLRHWKHPLIRWDADGIPIWPKFGFHSVEANARVIEPVEGIYLHHFQYRERDATVERLRNLCGARGEEPARSSVIDSWGRVGSDAQARYANLEDLYAGRWTQVERPTVWGRKRGVQPRPWKDQVPAIDVAVAKWYI
jgi:hypothetical protein